MDTAFARSNMMKQQLRPMHGLTVSTLTLLKQVPREAFVPKAYASLAFAETFIPLDEGQTMLTPLLEAQLLQALQVKSTDKVLEVGTGSGYMTALLSKAAQHVYSIDIFACFIDQAMEKLAQYNIQNCTLMVGNAAMGWDKHQPYDCIALTGSLPHLPNHFIQQLKIGGRLFAIVGKAPLMKACLMTRVSDHQWHKQILFETNITPLLKPYMANQFNF